MMFIKVVDLDTNDIALINPERITIISRTDGVYQVVLDCAHVNISDADFERICSVVGYAVGNGSEPVKYQVPPHDQNPTQFVPDALGGLGAYPDRDDYEDEWDDDAYDDNDYDNPILEDSGYAESIRLETADDEDETL